VRQRKEGGGQEEGEEILIEVSGLTYRADCFQVKYKRQMEHCDM
jgi:hypothetical protein